MWRRGLNAGALALGGKFVDVRTRPLLECVVRGQETCWVGLIEALSYDLHMSEQEVLPPEVSLREASLEEADVAVQAPERCAV